jgi:hypothetical protein
MKRAVCTFPTYPSAKVGLITQIQLLNLNSWVLSPSLLCCCPWFWYNINYGMAMLVCLKYHFSLSVTFTQKWHVQFFHTPLCYHSWVVMCIGIFVWPLSECFFKSCAHATLRNYILYLKFSCVQTKWSKSIAWSRPIISVTNQVIYVHLSTMSNDKI